MVARARKCQLMLQQVTRYPFAGDPQALMRTHRADTSSESVPRPLIQSIFTSAAHAWFASWPKSDQTVSFHPHWFSFI